jgi:hypothetical protein
MWLKRCVLAHISGDHDMHLITSSGKKGNAVDKKRDPILVLSMVAVCLLLATQCGWTPSVASGSSPSDVLLSLSGDLEKDDAECFFETELPSREKNAPHPGPAMFLGISRQSRIHSCPIYEGLKSRPPPKRLAI